MPARETSTTTDETSRVSDYWAIQSEEARSSRSVWLNNNIVADHIYRLISGGSPLHWLPWFLNEYLGGTTVFEKSLSICCGDGIHEIALYQSGKVRKICGFDVSEGAIARAISKFKEAAVPPENYCFEVSDANDPKLEGKYDLILSSGALHHVTNLECLLSNIAAALTVDGHFVVVEYVGPNRFQWTDRQIGLINGILRQLDVRYLKDSKRIQFDRPPIAEFVAIDPSEAVRSEEIVRLLEQFFAAEYVKHFNGTIVHPLYPLLNPELTNSGSADFDTILRLILFFEQFLIAENLLHSDFVFGIFRSKNFQVSGDLTKTQFRSRFVGFIDLLDTKSVCGWVADTLNPLKPVDVDIYINENFITTVRCDLFRSDLIAAGYVDGKKGFQAHFGKQHNLTRPATVKLLVHGSGELVISRTLPSET